MFSRSSQSSSNSQTPLNTVLNTPTLKLEFALLIFVCIDRMRKNLAATFEVDPLKPANTLPKSRPGFPAASSSQAVEDAPPPPYTSAPAEQSENLIDFDEPTSAETDVHDSRRPPRRTTRQQPQRPLKPYEEWDQQQSRQRLEQALASHEIQGLRRAALTFFDAWRMSVLRRVGTTIGVLGDNVRREKANREARGVYNRPSHGVHGQSGYTGIPTPLTRLDEEKRSLLVQSALLLLLGLENYPAHSRALSLYITVSLQLSTIVLTDHEISTAKILLSSTTSSSLSPPQSPPPEKSSSSGLSWKVGLATVGGAALIGVTGGLAAPLIAAGLGAVAGPVMGAFGLGGLASLLGGLIGNSVLVGALFGIYGGRRMGDVVERLSRDVEDFELLPLQRQPGSKPATLQSLTDEKQQALASTDTADLPEERLRVSICVSGSLSQSSDITTPWTVLAASSTIFALQYEPAALLELGDKLASLVNSTAFSAASYLVLRNTVFATLMAGLYLPMGILRMASVVDNPFNIALARSDKAGVVLAQILMAKAQGERPVSLVGFGLGARVVWECCRELARHNAFGLVGDIVLMGLPGPAVGAEGRETGAQLDWRKVRSVVTGRVVNCYSTRDWVLRFLYRMRAGLGGIAGMEEVQAPGIENEDVSDLVDAHASYGTVTGSILQRIGFEIDEDEVRKQTEKAIEAKRRDEINERRREGNVNLEPVLAEDGKVEMVDESSGKIVMLDLESGAVDEQESTFSADETLSGLESLQIGSSEPTAQGVEDNSARQSDQTLRSGQTQRSSIPEVQSTPPQPSRPAVNEPEHEESEDESDDDGGMAFVAPEPEPEPEPVSFGAPGSDINMTWEGR